MANQFKTLEEAVTHYGHQLSDLGWRRDSTSHSIIGSCLLTMAKQYHEEPAPPAPAIDIAELSRLANVLTDVLFSDMSETMSAEFTKEKRNKVAKVSDGIRRLISTATGKSTDEVRKLAKAEPAPEPVKPKKTVVTTEIWRADGVGLNHAVYEVSRSPSDAEIADDITRLANKRYKRKWEQLPPRPGLVFGSICKFYAVDKQGNIVGQPMITIQNEENEVE